MVASPLGEAPRHPFFLTAHRIRPPNVDPSSHRMPADTPAAPLAHRTMSARPSPAIIFDLLMKREIKHEWNKPFVSQTRSASVLSCWHLS